MKTALEILSKSNACNIFCHAYREKGRSDIESHPFNTLYKYADGLQQLVWKYEDLIKDLQAKIDTEYAVNQNSMIKQSIESTIELIKKEHAREQEILEEFWGMNPEDEGI